MTKQEFVIKSLKPYFLDGTKCGFEKGRCAYVTSDGKMCVAGQWMINPSKYKTQLISSIISDKGESNVFKDEAVGILSPSEWGLLQSVHDMLAQVKRIVGFKSYTKNVSNRLLLLEKVVGIDLTELHNLI